MNRKERIEAVLSRDLNPTHIAVENESAMHAVPKNSETHFKVLVVSDAFEGLSRIDRHRRVHAPLADELKSGLHALTVRALTVAEFRENGAADFISPACAGGEKRNPG